MADISIFFTAEADEDPELLELEATNRGYRRDVYVRFGQDYFKLAIFDIRRLMQDYEGDLETYGFYGPEVNLVLVPGPTREKIIETIHLIAEKWIFFQQLKPTEDEFVVALRKQAEQR